MKLSFLALMFVSFIGTQSFGQLNLRTDISSPVYNYKQANTAALIRKHNFHNQARVGQIVVVQAENYKQSNSYLMSRKAVVVTKNDKNKPYPNYKHHHRVTK